MKTQCVYSVEFRRERVSIRIRTKIETFEVDEVVSVECRTVDPVNPCVKPENEL